MPNKIELTKEGVESYKAEYRHLIDVENPKAVEELAAARALGDLSENADYTAAKDRVSAIEERIKEIEYILANYKIIDGSKSNKTVSLGSTVEIKDLSDGSTATYKIVGTVEANPIKGLISNVSPLGHAIVGKHVGDECIVRVAQEYKVRILKIETK